MPGKKIRLDHLIVQRGLAESGAKAQALLLAGRVRVQGFANPKPGALVPLDIVVEILENLRYVSRGGDKLEGALKDFSVDPKGRVCLDVGASTGGFTDCLLQKGATFVAAVDVGRGQLHWKLRNDPRVLNIEKTHILKLQPSDLEGREPSLVVADVSFISLEKILPHVSTLLRPGTEVITLVKPQFEAGPKFAPKGVVRDPEIRKAVVEKISKLLPGWNFEKKGETLSPLQGPSGNVEYFLYFVRIQPMPPAVSPDNEA